MEFPIGITLFEAVLKGSLRTFVLLGRTAEETEAVRTFVGRRQKGLRYLVLALPQLIYRTFNSRSYV